MTKKELKTLYEKTPYNIYLICLWAKYGIRECKWTGNYIDFQFKESIKRVPEIIEYSDCNGERDLYYTCPIFHASTGSTNLYYFSKYEAEKRVDELNEQL